MHATANLQRPAPPDSENSFVLLVDDHESSLLALREVVELAGHTCYATLSSSEALQVCREKKPSLVVTDLMMPELDGYGLGLSIKEQYPSVPMLLVTGELLNDTKLQELGTTFAAVMSKPLQVERFLELVETLAVSTNGSACP